ncbi:hypothetical protein [Photobacterium carnosum]|uniref:Uncharacterized protein n=1 Tax=Photobacterium carnosum TaxID=2023717 RepID=A0A2N4UVW6_9GAMM|nr:hypothetical protein [Photobacterium carnosum]MCD9498812.1 hypothetical protein [Photobacterium carnosum]MCD9521451.1 hypothetical protein [Photobacterium carnosum]MCD9530439.1 hypothetical protein [Photobacterium carnosum]MCD9537189.1 hypothetical protein [Photobacterium carnosum]MCD9541806.1 hypothetical protein [Photobacterium carnosum]
MKKSTKSALVVLGGIVICSLAFTMIKSEQTKNNNTTAQQTTSTTLIKDKPYKCSDFDPKTGGLKGWTADMGIGPAIPEQLLPKDCPALQQ